MSSRILRGEQGARAEPVVWPDVVAARPPQGRPQGEVPADEFERRLRAAHEEGWREGEAAARRRLDAVIEQLARSVEDLATLRARLRRQAEADLVHLAVAIARRILRRELSLDPDAIAGLVHAALQRLAGQEIARVRVHPELAVAVRTALAEGQGAQAAEVVADARLEAGAVIFETERGNLDASVETQLAEIERGLADRLRKSGP
ncbi:MAG TPA: FliH/SctL family protein [Bryobacteraceae bacterium]|nr:FliH/SctL family protein [Bryobacteraceae bacterium]